MSRLAELATLMEDLIRAAEETASELSREELDPDRLAELMARREETFRALQEAYESGRRTEATSQAKATPTSPASSVSSASLASPTSPASPASSVSPASPVSRTAPRSPASPGSRVSRATATSPAPSNPPGIAADPKLRELVGKLLDLDRSNVAKMRRRLEKLRADVRQVQHQRRSLTAYGWVDPVHAPKGAFIDKTQG